MIPINSPGQAVWLNFLFTQRSEGYNFSPSDFKPRNIQELSLMFPGCKVESEFNACINKPASGAVCVRDISASHVLILLHAAC